MYQNKLSKYQNKLKQIGSAESRAALRDPFTSARNTQIPRTVFSVLENAHVAGNEGILPFLSGYDVDALRKVNVELRDAARNYLGDMTPITGSLADWRAANPRAIRANIHNRQDITDADFVHLVGIKELNMSSCLRITDAAFAHLAGVHTLYMAGCNQITDAAFVHLAGVHTLDMSYCNQATITDAAFAHLAGVHTLEMSGCWQETITDAAFAHLAGVHTLSMIVCWQAHITGKTLCLLESLKVLKIVGTNPRVIAKAYQIFGVTPLQINVQKFTPC